MNEKCSRLISFALCCVALVHLASASSEHVVNTSIRTQDRYTVLRPSSLERVLLQSGETTCDGQSTIRWHTCMHNGCGANVESDFFEEVTGASCVYNEIRRMWDCGSILLDTVAFDALTEGSCTQSCSPEPLDCEFVPRFETVQNVPIISSECDDGSVTTEFNCGCQLVDRTEMLRITQAGVSPVQCHRECLYVQSKDGSQGGCSAVCSKSDRDLSSCFVDPPSSQPKMRKKSECPNMVCLYQNCAAQVSSIAVHTVKESTCTFSLASRMWNCGGILEIDDPGYKAAKNGNCVESCSIDFRPDSCLFQARYGEHPEIETQSSEAKKESVKPKKSSRKKQKSKKKPKKTDAKEKPTGKIEQEEFPSKEPETETKQEETVGKIVVEEEEGEEIPTAEPPPLDDAVVDGDGEYEFLELAGLYQVYDAYYGYYPPEDPFQSPIPQTSEKPVDPSPVLPVMPVREVEDPTFTQPGVFDQPGMAMTAAGGGSFVKPRTSRVFFDPDWPASQPPSDEFEVYKSPWMPCRQSCDDPMFGESIRERYVLCRSKASGLPVESSFCPSIAESPSSEACPAEVTQETCNGTFVYEFNDWSACTLHSDTCSRRREFECYERLEDGSLFPTTRKRCRALTRGSQELPCDPRQCNSVIYLPSEWGKCDCERGKQNRELICTSVAEPELNLDPKVCEAIALPRPTTQRSCECETATSRGRRLLQATSCAGRDCTGNGICRSGACACYRGFEGDDCQKSVNVTIENDASCQQDLRINGACCLSGIYDFDFGCCTSGASLDRDGNCCDGVVDACGVCNGSASFVDAFGTCCETTLDANGLCCMSGNVDECGVCDGFGMSCDFRLTFALQSASADDLTDTCVENLVGQTLRLRQDATDLVVRHARNNDALTVFVPGQLVSFDRSVGAVSILVQENLADRNRSAQGCSNVAFELDSVRREPVQGNGYCIFRGGIQWRGIDDCSFVMAVCPVSNNTVGDAHLPCSGKGICSFAGTASCTCFEGYSGDACDQCSSGFELRRGHCLPTGPEEQTTADDTEVTQSNILDETEPKQDQQRFTVIVGTLLSVLIFIIFTALVAAVYLSFTDYNGFAQNLPSTLRTASSGESDNRSRITESGTDNYDHIASSVKTASSSGAPIGGKLEPEEVTATPNKSNPASELSRVLYGVSELVDGSNFHGNTMHRPFLASSSSDSAMNYPFRALSHATVDVSGEKRQSRRMPSPEEGMPLFPIEEGSAVNFEGPSTGSFDASSSAPLHAHKSSKSLDSSSLLHSFDRWLDFTDPELEARPITPSGQPSGLGDSSDPPSSFSSALSDQSRGLRANESYSSFEFDRPSSGLQDFSTDRAASGPTSPEPRLTPRLTPRLNFGQRWREFFRFHGDTPRNVATPVSSNEGSSSSNSNSQTTPLSFRWRR